MTAEPVSLSCADSACDALVTGCGSCKWWWQWQQLLWWLSSLLLNFQTSSHNSADDKSRRNSSEERSRPNSGDEKRKLSLSEGKVKKNMGEGKKRVSSGSSERGSKSPLKRAQEQSPRKRGRPPKDEKVCFIYAASGISASLLHVAEMKSVVCCSSLHGCRVLSERCSKESHGPTEGDGLNAWAGNRNQAAKARAFHWVVESGEPVGAACKACSGRGLARKKGRH